MVAGERSCDAQHKSIVVAVAITVLTLITSFLIGALAVQIRQDIPFGEARLGGLISIFSIAAGVISVPAGRLVERIGARRGIQFAACIMGLAATGIAMYANSWGQLAIFLAIGGVAAGMGQPAANLALAQDVAIDKQGLAFGLKQAAVPMASFVAGLTVPIAAGWVGWKSIFALSGLAALPVVLIANQTLSNETSISRVFTSERSPIAQVDLGPLLVLAVGGAFGGSAVASLAAFTVEGAVDIGLQPEHAGLILTLGSSAAVAVRIGAGWQADRRGRKHLVVVAGMLVVGAFGFALIALSSHPGPLIVGVVVGAGAGWGWNGLFHYAVVHNQRQAPAAASSITQTGLFLGAAIGPFAFGTIVQSYSYTHAWFVAVGWLLLAAVFIGIGRWRFGRALLAVRDA